MRIDKVLWFLRLAKTRPLAQALVTTGHIRLNGRRVERTHQTVAVGDVLVIPLGRTVRVIELVSLPLRRGPAPEAQACYRTIGGGGGRATDADDLDKVDLGADLDGAAQSPLAPAAFNDTIDNPGERDLQP